MRIVFTRVVSSSANFLEQKRVLTSTHEKRLQSPHDFFGNKRGHRFIALYKNRELYHNDGDVNESGKKAEGFMIKTTTSHVQLPFFVHFFAVTARLRLEITSGDVLYGGHKHKPTNFSFSL